MVLKNSDRTKTTPTVVAFSPTGELLVGVPAKDQALTNATKAISGVKAYHW